MAPSTPDVTITICGPDSDAARLAAFFCANLTREYISHSELQSNRTDIEGQWAPDIEAILTREFHYAIQQDASARAVDASWNGVIAAEAAGTIVGVAIVLYAHEDHARYGVIEDIIVDKNRRGEGIGKRLIEYVLNDMRASNLSRVFLESGINNEAAHELFHRLGFENASVVMKMDL